MTIPDDFEWPMAVHPGECACVSLVCVRACLRACACASVCKMGQI